MDQVDAIVVGAGAVGLAVARGLAQAGLETIVAEAQTAIGQGVSSRNSEVIHAGLYYPPGSLKARLCVRGKELLYEFCASHGVSHRNCGKLVVANSEAEASALAGLRERAVANGVPVDWLDARRPGRWSRLCSAWPPCCRPARASWTAMASCWRCRATWKAPVARWRWALPSTRRVLGKGGGSHVVRMADGSEIAARVLVNSASLHACALARRFDGLDPKRGAARVLRQGQLLRAGRQGAIHPPGLPGAGRCLVGRASHARPGRAGQVRPGPGVAGRRAARRHRLHRRSKAGRGLLCRGPALLAGTCPTARCNPATAACGPRSTAPARRLPTFVSTGRRRTGSRAWSTCSASNRPG